MWDLSSPTRARTHIPWLEGGFITTGPPGKSPQLSFITYCYFSASLNLFQNKKLTKILLIIWFLHPLLYCTESLNGHYSSIYLPNSNAFVSLQHLTFLTSSLFFPCLTLHFPPWFSFSPTALFKPIFSPLLSGNFPEFRPLPSSSICSMFAL